MHPFSGLLVIIIWLILPACGTAPAEKPLVMADTTGLEMREDSEDLLLFVRPGVQELSQYLAFIVEPVEVAYTSSTMTSMSQQDIAHVKRYFQRAVISELRSHDYQIVHKPGERVLRVQLKLTGLDPGGRVRSRVGGGGSSATVEAELRESLSDRLDAVAVTRRSSGSQPSSSLSQAGSIEPILDGWAVEFREALDRARRKS